MRLSIWEGSATVFYLNWTTGAVLVGYLLYLGATPVQLAMASSIPALAQAISPIAAWIYSHYPSPRKLVTVGGVLARCIWILPALLPFFITATAAEPTEGSAASLVLWLIAFSSIFGAAIGTIWTSWMGSVVPSERRGRYFGLRNGIHAVVGLCANLLAGVILDALARPYNYQALFFGAFVAACIALSTFPRHYEPVLPRQPRNLRDTFIVPLRDRNFRRFLGFAFYWQFAVFIGSVFVYPYLIGHLKLTYTQIAIYQAIAAVTTLVCGPIWGRIADMAGNRSILSVTTVLAGYVMIGCWMLASPGNPEMVYISGFVDGLAWSAINAAIFNLALATAEPVNRISYIGAYSMVTGIAGFLGGTLAGPILELAAKFEFTVSGFQWSAFHWLFLISATLRSCAFLFVKGVRETRSWSTRTLLRHLVGMKSSGFGWR
ncbi:MFS transporter [bacterium]|nr:MFS transporter [bacterium]